MMKICLYLGVLIPIDWSDEVKQDIEHNILQTEDYIIVELFGSHSRLIRDPLCLELEQKLVNNLELGDTL